MRGWGRLCTCSLIDKQVVLTAAHCATGVAAGNLYFQGGASSASFTTYAGGAQSVQHPGFTYNPDDPNSIKMGLAFYKPDYGLDLGPDAKPIGTRSNFVRGPDGNLAWFRNHGRLYRRQ